MSDADDQMGGTGGQTGSPPEKVKPGADNAAPGDRQPDDRPDRQQPGSGH
jgi:hypothetical protein